MKVGEAVHTGEQKGVGGDKELSERAAWMCTLAVNRRRQSSPEHRSLILGPQKFQYMLEEVK